MPFPETSAYSLGSDPKASHERLSHMGAVTETGFACDDFKRLVALLYHKSSGLQAQCLNGLGWRLACLGREYATELASAKVG